MKKTGSRTVVEEVKFEDVGVEKIYRLYADGRISLHYETLWQGSRDYKVCSSANYATDLSDETIEEFRIDVSHRGLFTPYWQGPVIE